MRRRTRQGAAALALTLLGFGVSGPAAAAPPSGPGEPQHLLLLGPDSSGPWSDNLTTPLFDADVSPIVPGDVARSFWVFNNTGTKANLSLSCEISAVPPPDEAGAAGYDELATHLSLTYRVGDNGEFEACDGGQLDTVHGRDSEQVEVKLSFVTDEEDPPQVAMNQTAAYSITATLTQIPPKSGGKPRVLGSQTLVAAPEVSEPTTSGTTDTGSTTEGTKTGRDGTSAQDKSTPAKTTKVAAALRGEDGAVTESLPLVAGLLILGALMAGFRRRHPEAD